MRIACATLVAALIIGLAVKTAAAQGTPRFQVLHSFAGGATDGSGPATNLALDHLGNLFGITFTGGGNGCNLNGCGVAFRLAPTNGHWRESAFYDFVSPNDTGFSPDGSVAVDSQENVYGTEYVTGDASCNCGTVYQIMRGAGGWTENILHSFVGQPGDGSFPSSGIVQDAEGNLFGSTFSGGAANAGTIFELTPGSNGTWTYNVIYEFGSSSNLDGNSPYGPLFIDSSGNIFGTTQVGGIYGDGAVFKLSPSGGVWTETVLYNFTLDSSQSQEPYGVVAGANGVLYGITLYGGEYSVGTMYELTPGVGFWNRSVLYTFTGGPDGAYPSSLLIDASGTLYGTSSYGGSYGYGNVFKFQSLNGKWKETVLHSFTGGSGGSRPYYGLTLDKQGNLDGVAIQGGTYGFGIAFTVTP